MQPLFEFDGDDKATTEKAKSKPFTTEKSTTISSTRDIELEKTYYPWESPKCIDQEDKETCEKFKPFCSMMGIIAYRRCRKTCKLCMDDNPSPLGRNLCWHLPRDCLNFVIYVFVLVLKANLSALSVNASMTLTQTNPDAPTFMTVCALIDEDIHTYSALIHSFGEVAQNGKICQSFGPHYNPFGVSSKLYFQTLFS